MRSTYVLSMPAIEFFRIIEFPAAGWSVRPLSHRQRSYVPFFSGSICCCSYLSETSKSLSEDGKRSSITYIYIFRYGAQQTTGNPLFFSSPPLLLISRMTSFFLSLNHLADVHTRRDTRTHNFQY